MSIADDVRRIITETLPERLRNVELREDTHFIEQLGLPSAELVLLFSRLEAHFDIDIFDADYQAEQTETVGRVLALVEARCSRRR